MERIAITWQVSDVSGWGVFGLNLINQLIKIDGLQPLLLLPPDLKNIDPISQRLLEPLLKEQSELSRLSSLNIGKIAKISGAAVLHHLTDALTISDVSKTFKGDKNLGIVFFETTTFDKLALQHIEEFDSIIAGSSWNGEVLQEQGLKNIQVLLQGVDTSLFRPFSNGREKLSNRFIIFSGGKLEYRKGQDIVLSAFKKFYSRHPDAILAAMWHSPWPKASRSMQLSPHVKSLPELNKKGEQKISKWALQHGVPESAFVDLGLVPNSYLPNILRNVDAAVFPNRCEGGTNLVAMECMATGIPCVLSANTGHLDLISPQRCYVLSEQKKVPSASGETEGWGESSVEELLELMETLYDRSSKSQERGIAGARWIQNLSWNNQARKLFNFIESLGDEL